MTNKVQKLYDLTKEFNTISGSVSEVNEKAFLEQYGYIKEEFRELTRTVGGDYNLNINEQSYELSLETYMLEQALDDCLDIVITVFGFMQKLETLGVDVGQAGIDTANNNLSKYTNIPAVVYQTIDKLKTEKGIDTFHTFNQEYNRFVIRNKENGKIVKPSNFVSNDLSKYITNKVKENYARASTK